MGGGDRLRGASSWGRLSRGSIASAGGKMEKGEKPWATSTIITIPSLIPMLENSNGIVVREPDCYTTTAQGSNPCSAAR